jgi:hypothetical protein
MLHFLLTTTFFFTAAIVVTPPPVKTNHFQIKKGMQIKRFLHPVEKRHDANCSHCRSIKIIWILNNVFSFCPTNSMEQSSP